MKNRSPRLLIVLAVAALVTPVAGATWYVSGSHEPDNALDSASFMYFDPPTAGERKIYFNVVEVIGPGIRGMAISPNVGLLQTTHTTPAMETFTAIFGVWVDCNGDGYVGIAESAMREYPSNLLLDDSVCPATSGDPDVWTAGAHNYNGWVSELVAIAGIANAFSPDDFEQRVYRDPGAIVWGDPGKPDDNANVGGSCPLAPQPRGTYQSTGGTLNYISCFTGLIGHYNNAWTGRNLAGVPAPGLYELGVPDLGLTFENGDAQGSFADVDTFGSEDSSQSPVHVWDCEADPIHSGVIINDTFGSDAATIHMLADDAGINSDNFSVYQVNPTVGEDLTNPRVLPAIVNDTQEGTEDCDTSNDNGHDFYGNNYVFYVGETDFAPVGAANKTAAQFNFQFQQWGRGGNPLGLDCVTFEDAPCDFAPWPSLPIWGGRAGMAAPVGEFSNYNPGAVTTQTVTGTDLRGRHLLVDLSSGSADIPRAPYWSWYAHVSAVTTAKGFGMPGGVGAYGSAQCGENDSGIHAGWNCDPAVWYHNPDGSPQPEPQPLARVGQAYEFRDVDCYDGHVGNSGLAVDTPAYGANPCQPPVS